MSTATARITIDEYHAMAERGELRPDSKDYLWHGEIVEVMTQNPPHADVIQAIGDALRELFPKADWTVKEEKPLVLPDDSEPLPDLVVARGRRDRYTRRHPRAEDVVLLVEVSHSTKAKDLGEKLNDYAAAGIPLYWVADVEYAAILAFWDPDPAAARYRSSRIYPRGEAAETPAGVVRVDDVFP